MTKRQKDAAILRALKTAWQMGTDPYNSAVTAGKWYERQIKRVR
jgi:hypothetical protein